MRAVKVIGLLVVAVLGICGSAALGVAGAFGLIGSTATTLFSRSPPLGGPSRPVDGDFLGPVMLLAAAIAAAALGWLAVVLVMRVLWPDRTARRRG
jgi:hypothetical protein